MTRKKPDIRFLWNLFVYFSIIFLVFAMYQADYLLIPEIHSGGSLAVAIFTLFLGLLVNAFVWKKMLAYIGTPVDLQTCIISVGASIFGKYIPGKIWIVVGKAAYVAHRTNLSLGRLSALVVNLTLLNFLVSACAGMVGIHFFSGSMKWMMSLLLFSVVLTTVLFTQLFPATLNWTSRYIFKSHRDYPAMPISANFKIIPWVVLNILIWSYGFYYLAESLSTSAISPLTGLGYPLAMTLGAISFISPGGLGFREGALVIYLLTAGLNQNEAVTIAAASRLWFLIGEVFIFAAAMILKRYWGRIDSRNGENPLRERTHENGIDK